MKHTESEWAKIMDEHHARVEKDSADFNEWMQSMSSGEKVVLGAELLREFCLFMSRKVKQEVKDCLKK